jgi:hypothetical protein
MKSNILVQGSRARAAGSIDEIRSILGVRTHDNLRSARIVLVTEGNADRSALLSILPTESEDLKVALASGDLAVEPCHGVSHLVSTLSRLRNELCLSHVLVDNDSAGVEACRKAEDLSLLSPADRNLVTCPGLTESEFEDLVDIKSYEEWVKSAFGVDLGRAFRSGKKKWSDRMGVAFHSSGQIWDDDTMRRVKAHISEVVSQDPQGAIHVKRRGALDSLIAALESKVTGTASDPSNPQ